MGTCTPRSCFKTVGKKHDRTRGRLTVIPDHRRQPSARYSCRCTHRITRHSRRVGQNCWERSQTNAVWKLEIRRTEKSPAVRHDSMFSSGHHQHFWKRRRMERRQLWDRGELRVIYYIQFPWAERNSCGDRKQMQRWSNRMVKRG